MKKFMAATLISITALGVLTGCSSKDIGKDKAVEIALEDAGLAEADVTRLSVSKDEDDGRTVYEVHFSNEYSEYDYEVKASNGDILKTDMKQTAQNNSQMQQVQSEGQVQPEEQMQPEEQVQPEEQMQSEELVQVNQQVSLEGQANQPAQTESEIQVNQPAAANQNNSSQPSANSNIQITREEAVKLALDRVPGAAEQNLRIKLDYDDGYYKYEGDIIYDQKEYEFEIDANTGTFLEWSEETRQNNAGSQSNSVSSSASNNVQITREEAVKLALDRVPGATEQNLKIKLDYDDGYYKYEGDIIYDQKEYEFEIDANTGIFLEWSEEKR